MTPEQIKAVRELIEAAKLFLDPGVVDETAGTIPLMQRLAEAIQEAERNLP